MRFSDVARGGLRVIQSPSPQAYALNVATLFDECYSLALTQQRKNKVSCVSGQQQDSSRTCCWRALIIMRVLALSHVQDIPEGGSKGTILLNLPHIDKKPLAFAKFIVRTNGSGGVQWWPWADDRGYYAAGHFGCTRRTRCWTSC